MEKAGPEKGGGTRETRLQCITPAARIRHSGNLFSLLLGNLVRFAAGGCVFLRDALFFEFERPRIRRVCPKAAAFPIRLFVFQDRGFIYGQLKSESTPCPLRELIIIFAKLTQLSVLIYFAASICVMNVF